MVRYCARISFGAAMLAAFLTSPTRAEDLVVPPAAEPQAPAEQTTDKSVPAQTVSALTPAVTPAVEHRALFQHTSYPAAWTAAQKSNRPILVYVTMPGCPHCEQMLSETYHRSDVEHFVVDSFESIKINSQSQPGLVKALKVKWFPTTILVGTNNKVVDVIEGYVDPITFEHRLQTGLASAESSTQTR